MKKNYLFIAAAMVAVSGLTADAASWFVKSDAPDGNDGKTWETAFSLFDCITKMPDMAMGDNIYFAGGTYYYPEMQASGKPLITGLKMKNNPVNLYGSYPTDLTGTEVPDLTFPSATPTILNGDRNGNGIPDEGDLRNLIFVQTTKDATDLLQVDQNVNIRGFVLTNAYYAGTKTSELGAINADMSHVVTIRDCIFRGNKSENAGAAFSNSGSQIHFIDCVFEDNTGRSAGPGMNQSKRADAQAYFKATSVLERCLFTGNTGFGEGNVAGGCAIRLNAGACYLVNTTITGNKGYKQGAIHMNTDAELYIASSTIANNDITFPATGSAIYAPGTPKIRIINSYVLGIENDESVPAIVVADMTTKVSDVITSDGGNVLGLCNFASAAEGGEGFADNFASDVIIAGYDNYAATNTPYAIFGRTGLQDKGGLSKVLVPKEFARYYNKSDFAGLVVAEYKCPVEVDDQVDQRNVERPAVMAVGAYDADEGHDGVADAVAGEARGLAVTALGGGMYRLSTAAGDIAVYDLSGRAVARGCGETINLSGLTGGVYVIVADGAACKIVK